MPSPGDSANQAALQESLLARSAPARAALTTRGGPGIHGRQSLAGWIFVAPALAILVIFLVLPIGLAFYVSLTKWDGLSSPFGSGAKFVGIDNYKSLLTQDSLTRQNFSTAVRNNFYFVVLVVPAQTCLALLLAVLLNNKTLKGKSFFPHGVLFSLRDQQHRDHAGVPVPVLGQRCGQLPAEVRGYRRPQLAGQLRRGAAQGARLGRRRPTAGMGHAQVHESGWSAGDRTAIALTSRVVDFDPLAQVIARDMHARRWRAGRLEVEETYTLKERMYFRDEMIMMLRQVGFADIQVEGDYTGGAATGDADVLLFIARRP